MFSLIRSRLLMLLVLVLALLPAGQLVTAQDEIGSCPVGQGFWKDQPDQWPVTELVLGGQTYSQAELLALLNLSTEGDASLILAVQLIAAKLNVAIGADDSVITAFITQADGLLAGFEGKLPYGVEPSSSDEQQMVVLGSTFDVFNQGLLVQECNDVVELPTPTPTEPPPPDEASDDQDVTIVIEGPVQKINVNVITIFDIDIQVDPGDPVVTQIQVGDKIRVKGHAASTGTTIIIVAVNIVIIETNVVVVNLPTAPLVVPIGCKVSVKASGTVKLKCPKKPKKGSKKS